MVRGEVCLSQGEGLLSDTELAPFLPRLTLVSPGADNFVCQSVDRIDSRLTQLTRES
jgi:hypothetical protein